MAHGQSIRDIVQRCYTGSVPNAPNPLDQLNPNIPAEATTGPVAPTVSPPVATI